MNHFDTWKIIYNILLYRLGFIIYLVTLLVSFQQSYEALEGINEVGGDFIKLTPCCTQALSHKHTHTQPQHLGTEVQTRPCQLPWTSASPQSIHILLLSFSVALSDTDKPPVSQSVKAFTIFLVYVYPI